MADLSNLNRIYNTQAIWQKKNMTSERPKYSKMTQMFTRENVNTIKLG